MKRALIAVVLAVLVFGPLALSGEFKGTDDMAAQAIAAARSDFKPWMHPVWQPPSPEIESLLFALQAAAGAGVLGYAIGRRHEAGKHGARKQERGPDAQS